MHTLRLITKDKEQKEDLFYHLQKFKQSYTFGIPIELELSHYANIIQISIETDRLKNRDESLYSRINSILQHAADFDLVLTKRYVQLPNVTTCSFAKIYGPEHTKYLRVQYVLTGADGLVLFSGLAADGLCPPPVQFDPDKIQPLKDI